MSGRVYLDGAEALGKVFEAWGYGADRSRSVDEVARAAVMLVHSEEPSQLITTEADVAPAAKADPGLPRVQV